MLMKRIQSFFIKMADIFKKFKLSFRMQKNNGPERGFNGAAWYYKFYSGGMRMTFVSFFLSTVLSVPL